MARKQTFPVEQGLELELIRKYGPDDTPARCAWENCGAILMSAMGLDAHIRTEHMANCVNTLKFVCLWDGCPRGNEPFKQYYQLVQHIRGHSGFKPFLCAFPGCRNSYGRLENLKSHIRSRHTLERPFKCKEEGCGRSFPNCSDRNKHVLRVHSELKRYSCTSCEKYYSDVSSLRKHVLEKHGAEVYQRWKELRAEQRIQKRIVQPAQLVEPPPPPPAPEYIKNSDSDNESTGEIDVVNPSTSATEQLRNAYVIHIKIKVEENQD
uniref:C2H2-type domain-containing protein n=1 Tax=Steinernema glaseri TaxID=37863 RepID=A0A1I8ABW0_9BILA